MITKAELTAYAGYDTSYLSDDFFNFLVSATIDWANSMTGREYSTDYFTPSFKLLCMTLMGEVLRAQKRLGAEASEVNLDGISASYLQLSTKDNIKSLIGSNKAVYA